MPEIKIKHVTSFSSEDKVHKAENILQPETYRKWKCATAGEKSASIVLQFEKATKIHSIDIGNESSAFVEVLVGRSSDSVNEYQVLLGASSFMSPLESRNGNHINRVRMFDNEKLAQNLKEEKWDCVQVVCTQPFNKNITYGLTFIKFHSPPEKHSEQQPENETKTATTKLGAFELKYEEDEDSEPSQPVGNSWLKNRNSSTTKSPSSSQESPSFAAAVLASASETKPQRPGLSEYERQMLKNKEEQKNLMRSLKLKEAQEEFASAVNELKENNRASPKQSSSQEKTKRINVPKVNPVKRRTGSDEDLNNKPPKRNNLAPNASQKASTPKQSNKVEKGRHKPFGQIMDQVVFVLSGFVNPQRGDLRDKALEMGAKYKGDWDRTSTHLVCAFINTPKYIQVRGADGKIVTKEWIVDCYRQKKLLDWKKYKLGTYTTKGSSDEEASSSDEESASVTVKKGSLKANGTKSKDPSPAKKRRAIILSSDSEDEKPTLSKPNPKTTLNGNDAKPGPSKPVKIDSETEDEDALKDYMATTDVGSDSECDTEDEIRKVEEQAERKKNAGTTEKPASTDEEDSESLLSSKPDTTDLPLPELPNIFKKRHFYLYGEFSFKQRHDLQRFITACNGLVENYMSENIKYVVTDNGWDKSFEDALEENEDLVFVKPEWISKCHEAQKLIPYQAYIVIPN